jgi:hypothetical protein
MANQELAKQVLDHILAHPEQHDQGWWGRVRDCGTTMCIAGWTCELAGETLAWESTNAGGATWYTADGAYIPSRAAALLDLNTHETDMLFFTGKDTALRNLKHLADTGYLSEED